MATRYFGINPGASKTDVAEDASTTSKSLEVVVDLAVFTSAVDVLKALDLIASRLQEGVWPPA